MCVYDMLPVISVSMATKSHSAIAFCSSGRLASKFSFRISISVDAGGGMIDGQKKRTELRAKVKEKNVCIRRYKNEMRKF